MLIDHGTELPNESSNKKWLNSPISVYRDTAAYIYNLIPDFERRCFGLNQPEHQLSRINPRLDMIVRKPFQSDDDYVPIGVVSKDYQLVPHKDFLNAAIQALEDSEIDPSGTMAELTLTEYGERMRLSIFLPTKYDFDPGDGDSMAMRLECFNSVDGSTRFKVFIGWFRFVCSNGLVIGVTRTNFQHRHQNDLSIEDVKLFSSMVFRMLKTIKLILCNGRNKP